MVAINTLTESDLRMVLGTCRQVRSSGILNAGYFEQLMKRLPRLSGGDSTQWQFFKLTMDVTAETSVTALASTYDGTTSGSSVNVINWEGLLDGALTGYIGLFVKVDDEWVFAQGPCISE